MSESIFSGQSRSRSRLKFSDSAALLSSLGRQAGRRVAHGGTWGGAGNLRHSEVPKRYVLSEVTIYLAGKF